MIWTTSSPMLWILASQIPVILFALWICLPRNDGIVITMTSHGLRDGDVVTLTSPNGLSVGLKANKWYHVSITSETSMRIRRKWFFRIW